MSRIRFAHMVPMGVAGVTAAALGAGALTLGLGAGNPAAGSSAAGTSAAGSSVAVGSGAAVGSSASSASTAAPIGSAAQAVPTGPTVLTVPAQPTRRKVLAVPADSAGSPPVLSSTGSAPSLPAVQAKAAKLITQEVGALKAAITKVNADHHLGSGQGLILQHLQADVAPLQALGQKIASDTTVASAQTDAKTIVTGFGVDALVLPAARLAVGSDTVTASELPGLSARSSALAAEQTSSDQTSPDQPSSDQPSSDQPSSDQPSSDQPSSDQPSSHQAAVAPLLADLNAKIAGASTATSGLASSVEGFTPSQWTGNHALLAPARAVLKTASG